MAWRAPLILGGLAWVAGLVALAAFGRDADWEGFDPSGWSTAFSSWIDHLIGPAVRWDSIWFLNIADTGYEDGGARAAFFPLYPLLVAVVGTTGIPLQLAGLGVSLAALLAALVVLHRLVELDFGPRAATDAVWMLVAFPAACFFWAVYSESLYLVLSVGAIYAARTGRWPWAGALAALAASSRSVGLVLLVPIAVLYLYGPRADRAPLDVGGLRPRYPIRADALWLAVVPLGLLAYLGYLEAATGEGTAPFDAQEVWLRSFAGPFGGVWDGTVAAWDGARQLLSGSRTPVYFEAAGGDPFANARINLMLFAFMAGAFVALAGALTRLPAAYGLYALAALALPLSYPVAPQPLMSLPRHLAVLFPLQLWVALWARERGVFGPVLVVSAVGLAVFSAMFTTWHWIA